MSLFFHPTRFHIYFCSSPSNVGTLLRSPSVLLFMVYFYSSLMVSFCSSLSGLFLFFSFWSLSVILVMVSFCSSLNGLFLLFSLWSLSVVLFAVYFCCSLLRPPSVVPFLGLSVIVISLPCASCFGCHPPPPFFLSPPNFSPLSPSPSCPLCVRWWVCLCINVQISHTETPFIIYRPAVGKQ